LNLFFDVDLGSSRVELINLELKNIDPISKEVRTNKKEIWKIYFDGACNREGNGVFHLKEEHSNIFSS
jgi:hypothetical protein